MSITLSEFYERVCKNYLKCNTKTITKPLFVDAGKSVLLKLKTYKTGFTWRWQLKEKELIYEGEQVRYLNIDIEGNIEGNKLYQEISNIESLHYFSKKPENRYYPASKNYFLSFTNSNTLDTTPIINYITTPDYLMYCVNIDPKKIYINPLPTESETFYLLYKKNVLIVDENTELDIPDDFKNVFLYGLIYNLSSLAGSTLNFKNQYKDLYDEEIKNLWIQYKISNDNQIGIGYAHNIAQINRLGINNYNY